MADSAPIRPQRIMRANREMTGGLLMSVIRSLTTSRDSADRDRERLELEKGFQQCDSKLNELISEHGNDLYHVMTTFSKILANLSKARERLVDTREKLVNCQKLLHCKRDELKKLWLEILENRAVLELLGRVEQVSDLPKQVDSYAQKKHYLHAAQCCVDGLSQLGEQQQTSISSNNSHSDMLNKIEALSEVKTELLTKKEMLFERCIEELHRHLYGVATEDIRKRSQQQRSTTRVKSPTHTKDGPDEQSDSYPEEDSRQFILMLTKCIGLLNKIPEAVKIIKERFDEEFINMVIRTAQDILNANQNHFEESSTITTTTTIIPSQQPLIDGIEIGGHDISQSHQDLVVLSSARLLGHRYDGFSHLRKKSTTTNSTTTGVRLLLPKTSLQLRQLFDMLMKQFFHVISLHDTTVLFHLKRLESGLQHIDMSPPQQPTFGGQANQIQQTPGSTSFYSSKDIWIKMQLLLQQLLDYYLDISQISGQSASSSSATINYNLVSSLLPSAAVNMLFGSGGSNPTGTHPTATSGSNPVVTKSVENYSSFFVKRRPMMVAGAMNAMNVMMTSGKSTLTHAHLQQPSQPSAGGGNTTTSSINNTDGLEVGSNMATAGGQIPASGTSSVTSVPNIIGRESISSSTGSHLFHQPLMRSSATATQSNLFKFDHSTQAISWNSFLQQQRQTEQHGASEPSGTSDGIDEDNATGGSRDSNKSNQNQQQNINSRLFDSLQSICSQSPDNLVLLYDSLLNHINNCPINESKQTSNNNSINTLQSYLMANSEKFAQHINTQLDAMLEQAQKSLDSGMTIVLSCQSKDKNMAQNISNNMMVKNPQQKLVLLQSTVLVDVAVRDLSALMVAMADYRQHYLSYICNILTGYKDTCKRLYETLTLESGQSTTSGAPACSSLDLTNTNPVANNMERRSILSASWIRNEDFNRLLTSQPNWVRLQNELSARSPAIMASNSVTNPNHPHHHHHMMMIKRQMSTSSSFDESPEEIRKRNASEIDILINLLTEEITKNELLWTDTQLTLLANMQQSFEWLSVRCDDLVHLIQSDRGLTEINQNQSGTGTDLSEVYIATLNQLSTDFEELGQHCLLILHLEIRVHCCYHLQALDAQFFTTPAPTTPSDLSDDPRIIPLLEDLQRMYAEVSAAQLSTSKMNYLFEGLSDLMRTIFINAAMAVRHIKPNGIKRACRAIYDIQKCLSTITKCRELALDYARQYFEMLLLSPEEILSAIIERGAQFKPEEYANAITLLQQSAMDSCSTMEAHESNQQLQRLLKRLTDILNEVTA